MTGYSLHFSLADLLDTLKAVPAASGSVLPFKDDIELITTTRNVLVPRRGRDRDCRAHMNVYGRNQLPASDRGRGHRAPHNKSHSPDAF
jgi:hypothetical protein